MIIEAESPRPIGLAAEIGPYGACTTSFEQRGGCDCMYVRTIVLNHPIHAEFMHELVLYKTYIQRYFIKYTLKPKQVIIIIRPFLGGGAIN